MIGSESATAVIAATVTRPAEITCFCIALSLSAPLTQWIDRDLGKAIIPIAAVRENPRKSSICASYHVPARSLWRVSRRKSSSYVGDGSLFTFRAPAKHFRISPNTGHIVAPHYRSLRAHRVSKRDPAICPELRSKRTRNRWAHSVANDSFSDMRVSFVAVVALHASGRSNGSARRRVPVAA